MKSGKIETMIEALKQKRRFTFIEAEEIAKQIVSEQTVNYVVVEAITRLAREHKLKIELK